MTAGREGSGARPRVIVVEDSFPVADSLKFLLGSGGCEVVGMAGSVRAALDLIAHAHFDLALLDIDLRGERVTPVAEEVRRQAKPAVFLSGYGDAELLPEHLRAWPRLEKPVDAKLLFAAIEAALKAAPE